MAKYIGSRKRQELRKKKIKVGEQVLVKATLTTPGGIGVVTNEILSNVVEVKFDNGDHRRVDKNNCQVHPEKDEVVKA